MRIRSTWCFSEFCRVIMCIFSVNNLWYNIYLTLLLLSLSLFLHVYETFPIFFCRINTDCSHSSIQSNDYKDICSAYSLGITLFPSPMDYHWAMAKQQNKTQAREKKIAENGWNIFLASSNFVGMSEYSSFIKRSFTLSSPLLAFRIKKFS